MSLKPTLVLVPGSWHRPETWDKVIAILEKQQYKCVPVALPSTLGNTSVTYGDDVGAVRAAIEAETTQERDVVLIQHSYGGFVGSSAVKDLTRKTHDASSSPSSKNNGYVVGIVMIASGFNMTGISFLDSAGGKPPPSWTADVETGYATILAEPRDLFYHDLPEEEGNYWVSKLTMQALKPLMEGGEHVYSGWMDVPVWYLATSADKALPVEAQRFFVQSAKDAGCDVTSREVESSHSAMLSKPKEVVDFVDEAVVYFTKTSA